jgi:imidazolonepropionase
MTQVDLLITNIGQLVTAPSSPRRGQQMRDLTMIRNAALAVSEGRITAAGSGDQVKRLASKNTEVVDAGGRAVVPGFVDPHTHSVFAGERRDEFARRLAGESYVDILKSGGGILSTVQATRAASQAELTNSLQRRLARMLTHGTTSVEVKSGYGLNLEVELRMLAAVQSVGAGSRPARDGPAVVPTFLGAHALPPESESRREDYVALVCNEMLPAAKQHGARFCDAFCEEGAFTIDEARRILTAAKGLGMGLKLHTDQLTPGGGAELAAELGARSADHLGSTSAAGVKALGGSNTAAVLLPASTLYVPGASRAPARALIDGGAIVAAGSDFNPGSSPVDSMPLVMSLACLVYGLSVEEALTACTTNAAYAIGLEALVGCLLPGYSADLLILDTDDYRDVAYRLGARLVERVIKGGDLMSLPAQSGDGLL